MKTAKNAILKNNQWYKLASPDELFIKLTKDDLEGLELIEKAMHFASQAHDGQYRKSEPSVPYIVHPIKVAKILREDGFGGDKVMIAAALLHDVVEDTPYILNEVEEIFGEEVARLIEFATDNKELSWEEQKKAKIKLVGNLPFRDKLVIIADEIANLESLKKEFDTSGKKDFGHYHGGEVLQSWKFKEMFEASTKSEKTFHSIFIRYKAAYKDIFGEKSRFEKTKDRNSDSQY